jgi:DNA-binding CsgD family transcriptional regulator
MSSLELAQPLIEALYEAAIDSRAWQQFVQRLSDSTGGTAVALSLELPGAVPGRHVYRVGFQESSSEVFAQYARKGLPWGPVENSAPFDTRFVLASEVFPDEDLPQTEFYQEYMKPQGLAPEAPLAHLLAVSESPVPSGIALYRRVGGRPFGAADFDLVNLLVPHLKRSFQIAVQIGSVQRQRLALVEVLDRIPTGIVLLDEHRQPVLTNRAAQKIFQQEDGLTLGPGGVRAARPAEDRALRSLIQGALDGPDDDLVPDTFMNATRTSGGRGYQVMVSPLLDAPADSTEQNAAVVLYLTDAEHRQVSTADVLRALYSLSPAESELVQLLSSGHSLDEAARMRHVTMNTVRTQLKRVFAKTQTNGQADLVQMVLTGVAAVHEE